MLGQIHLIFDVLLRLCSLNNLFLMLTGIVIGFVFGIIPGLSGLVALTLILPLIYGMNPLSALIFLLSAHAVASTGGSVSSILVGIPGMEMNAATIIDGFPMTQQGKAGRALGAALMSSLLGGVVGALVLVLLIPILLPMALLFKSPELFLLIILGLLCIVSLSHRFMLRGLISGAIGIIISFIGYQGQTAISRFTFGSLYLYDGIKLVPIALGIFAIPVILDLFIKGTIVTDRDAAENVKGADVIEGVKDVFRHFWLFLRCSALGAWIGILPGVGGTVATFIAYAHAKSTARNRGNFGNGEVEGVIAPEAANNAKEGGALLPTLVLGIPGTSAMALLLGAFILVGLTPGPLFLVTNKDIAIGMIWTLVISNVIAGGLALLFCGRLARIAYLPGHKIAPFLLTIVFFGAYASRGMFLDVLVVLIFGALGYGMRASNYNRPALFLGYILGHLAEKYFYLAFKSHGPLFFLSSPICFALLGLIILVLFYSPISNWIKNLRRKNAGRPPV